MLVMPGESEAPRDVAAHENENDVLGRLAAQHRALLACVSLLESVLARGESAGVDSDLADKLLDELLAAPDDFHHFIEHRLFHRLWLRAGRLLPGHFDLDAMNVERRAARDAVVSMRETKAAGFWREADLQSALFSLSLLVRAQIETEETEFYPLLRNELASADWAEIEEEMNAFEACSRSLGVRRRL